MSNAFLQLMAGFVERRRLLRPSSWPRLVRLMCPGGCLLSSEAPCSYHTGRGGRRGGWWGLRRPPGPPSTRADMCGAWRGGRWYDFDDTQATPVESSRIVSPAAYLLFYRRRHEAALNPGARPPFPPLSPLSAHWTAIPGRYRPQSEGRNTLPEKRLSRSRRRLPQNCGNCQGSVKVRRSPCAAAVL